MCLLFSSFQTPSVWAASCLSLQRFSLSFSLSLVSIGIGQSILFWRRGNMLMVWCIPCVGLPPILLGHSPLGDQHIYSPPVSLYLYLSLSRSRLRCFLSLSLVFSHPLSCEL